MLVLYITGGEVIHKTLPFQVKFGKQQNLLAFKNFRLYSTLLVSFLQIFLEIDYAF